MRMDLNSLILFIFLIIVTKAEDTTKEPEEKSTQNQTLPSVKTVSQLFQEQTDAIRKLVESQRRSAIPEYPLVSRHEAIVKSEEEKLKEEQEKRRTKEEKEKQSIEDLKQRCQHFFLLSQRNKVSKEPYIEEILNGKHEISTTPIPTVEPFGPPLKPEFLKRKSTTSNSVDGIFIFKEFERTSEKYASTTQSNIGVKIFNNVGDTAQTKNDIINSNKIRITTPNTIGTNLKSMQITTPRNEHITIPLNKIFNSSPQKNVGQGTYEIKSAGSVVHPTYIRPIISQYEPLVLQNTLLTNGKNVYFWFRSVPKQIRNENFNGPSGFKNEEYGYKNVDSEIEKINEASDMTNRWTEMNRLNSNLPTKVINQQNELENKPINVMNQQMEMENGLIRAKDTKNEANRVISEAKRTQNTKQNQEIVKTQETEISQQPIKVTNSPIRVTNLPIEVTHLPTESIHLKEVKITSENTKTEIKNPIKVITQVPKVTTESQKKQQTQILPQYEIIYESNNKDSIEKFDYEDEEEKHETHSILQPELKFVLPWPYSKTFYNHYPQNSWQFDPYAYYPRNLQPNTMTIQVPYVPMFHMIRTISVPNQSNVNYGEV